MGLAEGTQPPSLFCPPSNGNFGTLQSPLEPQAGTSHGAHPLLRGNSDPIIPVLRFVNNVLHNPTPRVKGDESWESRGSRTPWLCFSVLNSNCQTTAAAAQCCVLPRSLGSAAAQVAHFCRSAQQVSLLLLAEGNTSHNRILPFPCIHGSPEPSSLLLPPFVPTCPPSDATM